ncbi:class I SAM-dependent methyltransferase [Candidatus Saccharibacteria bacterium]|nr:class I SAM-dependent methyltransferase [Candidatus Saccharibacteria bacterium]
MAWNNDQVSRTETDKILEVARDCLEVAGDFVELGCYKGDTSLLLADLLRGTGKLLYIYDSFEGLPEKRAEDESAVGENFKGGELYVTKREVKERFLRANLPVPVIKKAWFNELTDADLPEKIAFSFLDGDFYESIKDSLKLVEGKMAEGGIIIVHDYNNAALPGVARAVDEWIAKKDYNKIVVESMVIIET